MPCWFPNGGSAGVSAGLVLRLVCALAALGASAALPEDDVEAAQERRLAFTGIDWEPPQVSNPPGGGAPVLFAGKNYTRWELLTDTEVRNGSRLILSRPTLDPSAARIGNCILDDYTYPDKTPPLDGLTDIPSNGSSAVWIGGMVFSQGGVFKLCWSPDGTFGTVSPDLLSSIIPFETATYRVYGAYDTCIAGPLCFANRKFFCHAPHRLYVQYIPQGTRCFTFMHGTNAPLLYSRLTWMEGWKCGIEVGDGMAHWNRTIEVPSRPTRPAWAREVDPLSRIDLGHTRYDLSSGFRYRICYCPSYDAESDGVCGEPSDFVQQVGYLHAIVVSFVSVDGEAVGQVLPMTRFTIRVDCGGGDWCGTGGTERIKVIERAWAPFDTAVDLPHWDAGNACPNATEALAWYSPANCAVGASECTLEGGADPAEKLFGVSDVRFLPRLESGIPVAQFFDVCFVHNPLEADNISQSGFDPGSDDALQNNTRMFWKVGQLVIEPFVVLDPLSFVVFKEFELRIAPIGHANRTNTAHNSETLDPEAAGAIVKLVEEERTQRIDDEACGLLRTLESSVDGLICPTAEWCTPRAVKRGDELVLNGGDPSHRLRVKKAGNFAVCYCENWPGTNRPCDDTRHWVLVGRVPVAGPMGNEEWVLDTGMIQSLEISGYGLSNANVVRIIQAGRNCEDSDSGAVETSIRICNPALGRECQFHGPQTNSTHIADLSGVLWMHNATRPESYIESITPTANGRSLLRFAEVPVLEPGDTIHVEPNVQPLASHWARQRDLERIIKGEDIGHQVLELQDFGKTALIPLDLDPFPPLQFTPDMQGTWYRSNKIHVPNIRGTVARQQLSVCWGETNGEYNAWAGYVNFVEPARLARITMGLTTTAVGSSAPVIVTFRTGTSHLYREARNSMQLRMTFTNTSILAPAESSIHAGPLPSMTAADQLHEASQSVCGLLFVELYSHQEFGFPVPLGCYVDLDRYQYGGEMQSFYILFGALNGLQRDTEYTLVFNAKLVETISDYSVLELPLIELATLDDVIVKREGIVDVDWVSPDKPVVEKASGTDPRFFNGQGGVTLTAFVQDQFNDIFSDDSFIRLESDQVGMRFLLRGDEVGRIEARSILRLYFWPLTAWDFNYRELCSAECIAQEGHTCGPIVGCQYDFVITTCIDDVPPGARYWFDSQGRRCEWYELAEKCKTDGTIYTPSHGMSARDSCCACGGGVRANSNVVKFLLPERMDDVYGSEIIHTIRFWGVRPMTQRGFFATRFGIQLTNRYDQKPDYSTTAGKHVIRSSLNPLISPVATLVAVDGWGNGEQFKAATRLNDVYLRLQMPVTLYSSPLSSEFPSLAAFEIALPEGYECIDVLPASPRGEGANKIPLPVLPVEPPTGNGMLPSSSSATGYNSSSMDREFPVGWWEFSENRCIFRLAPTMVLFERQRLFFYIFARNPVTPLPKNDPMNFWTISFNSSGYIGEPVNYSRPCEPFHPPACNDTGESYYVNPMGTPIESRSYERLFPNETELASSLGPARAAVPTDLSREPQALEWYTDSFAVLGILKQLVVQPSHFHTSVGNTLQIWFVPDLGSDRGGLLGIQIPLGFSFGDPCVVRDLPDAYYATHAPAGGDPDVRVWPLEGKGDCELRAPPSWSPGGLYMVVHLSGALIPARYYGLEVEVTNPDTFDPSDLWAFRVDISDANGYGRDATNNSAVFSPDGTEPWALYPESVRNPVVVAVHPMLPYLFTGLPAEIDINPITLDRTIVSQFRVIAPEGYEWAWNPYYVEGTFITFGLPNQTMPLPGGAPPLPASGRLNVIEWASHHMYVDGHIYAFRTYIHVPHMQTRASANAFFFEWNYSYDFGDRGAAARAPAAEVRALRGAKVEASSTLHGDAATVWVWVETITPISVNGSLEVQIPYSAMTFDSFSEPYGKYCLVRGNEEFGSAPLPDDIHCRRVLFPNAYLETEIRIELFANVSGLPPGRYVLEFNVTNPPQARANSAMSGSPCSYRYCMTIFSMERRYEAAFNIEQGEWMSEATPFPSQWQTQNDYWTSIPALSVTAPMAVAEIVNLTLDERLACGRFDRPGLRNALVFVFALNSYIPQSSDELGIRAPVGYVFDSMCDFWTAAGEVYPGPSVRPSSFESMAGATWDVEDWPETVVSQGCRGDGHVATIQLNAGLVPQRLYMFRVGIRRNPITTPVQNAWSLTYGGESSGMIPGFPIWTFPHSHLDPISLSWTVKHDPLPTTVALQLEVTNSLYATTQQYVQLHPMMRITMPPLFEVLVDSPNQDIQGGSCFMVLQQIGLCRLCGVPFPAETFRCVRETNRKNVAKLILLDGAAMYRGLRYQVWITIYNPHIMNSDQMPPRSWTIESFYGQPAPPAVAPEGYVLDKVEVPGYKISGLAELTVEAATDLDASAYIAPKLFTMRLPRIIRPGDIIEVHAPPDFDTSIRVLGLVDLVLCRGFEYLPVVWPINISTPTHDILVQPPPRGPLPPVLPPWAHGHNWTVQLPVNTSNTSLNESGLLQGLGVPAWGLDAALGIHEDSLGSAAHNASHEHLALQSHCLGHLRRDGRPVPRNLSALHVWDNLTAVADWTNLSLSVVVLGDANDTDSGAHHNASLLCLQATWLNKTMEELAEILARCQVRCNGTAGLGASNQSCIEVCANASNFSTEELCMPMLPGEIPPNASLAAYRILPPGSCSVHANFSGDETRNASDGAECCGAGVGIRVEVLWRTPVNLTKDLEDRRADYEAAVSLRAFDAIPFQTVPRCEDNLMVFRVAPGDLHPEPQYVNGTTIRFLLGFQNPRRPPLLQQNFWIVRHHQEDKVVSSDAVPSWALLSRLRYVTIGLLSEILRPTNPAEIHFEFVTVNPANQLVIIADSPEGFDFSQAYVNTTGNETSGRTSLGGRRLLWEGFTSGVEVASAVGNRIVLSMSLGSREYVRFCLAGVLIPWLGGQALFTLLTSIHGLEQDEVRRCCEPGFPPDNPSSVFLVPHRLGNLRGSLANYYQSNPRAFPIASTMETRLYERHLVTFTFLLAETHRSRYGSNNIVFIVRAPEGYEVLYEEFLVQDMSAPVENANSSVPGSVRGQSAQLAVGSYVRRWNTSRIEAVLFGLDAMRVGAEYSVSFYLMTPHTHAIREDNALWVFELTDLYAVEHREVSTTLGAMEDFSLVGQVNFTVGALKSPPEVVIEVTIDLFELGEISPNRVDVYAPSGYIFLFRCFAPGEERRLRHVFVSCRERWSLFNTIFLSGAVMMTVDQGVPADSLPLQMRLLVRTPAVTPQTNTWYIRSHVRQGPVAWGLQQTSFPVRPMEVNVTFAAIAGTRVPLFLSLRVRDPLPWGGHIHLAGPRLYQLLCPVNKVLAGTSVPDCTNVDSVLNGCWGLPSPGDPGALLGLPLCDPLHELLLTFVRPANFTGLPDGEAGDGDSGAGAHAINTGEVFVLALEARVPDETPRPRSENVFRVRLLDESKIAIDGKLNCYSNDVSSEPVVQDFRMWFTRAVADSIVTVAIEFTFNQTVGRADEDPNARLLVIEIVAPDRVRMASRRPRDIQRLNEGSLVPVVDWNWTATMPRRIWFMLDPSRNISGKFHYSFPVLMPSLAQGMPADNLWQVKFCADAPYCSVLLLMVPIPGFAFGEEPDFELDASATSVLAGSPARRRTEPFGRIPLPFLALLFSLPYLLHPRATPSLS